MSFFLPDYTVIVKPRQKHTYLRLREDGTIIITTPGLTPAQTERLLLDKSEWIARARKKLSSKKGRYPIWDIYEKIWYTGKNYPLRFEKTQRYASLRFCGESFRYRGPKNNEALHRALDRFYKKVSENIIVPLVREHSEKMKLFFTAIRFRKTKRQWGSCSSNDALSFNTMLCKVPIEAIEYVVVHELAHIVYKNHSRDFWRLVERHLPDYQERKSLLRDYLT